MAHNLHDAPAHALRAEAVDTFELARKFAVGDPRRASYTAEAQVLATLALSAPAEAAKAPARRARTAKPAATTEEAAK